MRQPRDHLHTVTVTCTYEGPIMANNLPAPAVPDDPFEKDPLSGPSELRLMEMLCQENSVGCQCMVSALTSSSSRSPISLTSILAAIWILSEARGNDSIARPRYIRRSFVVSQRPMQLVRLDRAICHDRCLAFSIIHALNARATPLPCCGRYRVTGLSRST